MNDLFKILLVATDPLVIKHIPTKAKKKTELPQEAFKYLLSDPQEEDPEEETDSNSDDEAETEDVFDFLNNLNAEDEEF